MYYLLRPADEIRKELVANPKLRELLEPIRQSAAKIRDEFSDDVTMVTGWGHNFVCPKCAGHLTFDEAVSDSFPCPVCDGVGEGKDVYEAWIYYRRHSMAVSICNMALMVYLGEEGFTAEDVLRPIRWYADRYIEFPEHGRWAGRGRVMGQSLDEAVWAIKLLHALRLIGFDGGSELGRDLHHKLFLPMSRLVMAQSGVIHNIPLWHASAAVGSAVMFGDERLLQQSLGVNPNGHVSGELGGYNQVVKGFTPDGLWNENSTGYHYYSVEAANNMIVFLRSIGKEYPELYERLCKAYTASIKIAFINGDIPAMNDGWRGQNAYERTDTLRAAYRMLSGAVDTAEIEQAIWHNPEATQRPSLGSLLYGTPKRPATVAKLGSANLTHNYMAMMRGPIELFLKYGNIWTSHAHPDALHIDLFPWARDTGTTGYGAKLHREFYTKTIAHNTFAIDCLSMNGMPHGKCVLADDGLALRAEVDDAYPGVVAKRDLVWQGSDLHDDMTVTCEQERVIDWIFHAKGEFSFEGVAEAAEPLGTENGYQHLRDVKLLKADSGVFTWTFEGQTLSLKLQATQGAQIFLTVSPDNPGHLIRNGIVVRLKGKQLRVSAKWTDK